MTENVCRAASTPRAALVWTTLAFFGGFAGVSAFGPILARLKSSMAIDPLAMGLLAACPALTGSLLRIPFGALVDRLGGKRPILLLLGLAAAGVALITWLFSRGEAPTADLYPLFLLGGVLCGSGIAVFSVGIPAVSYWYPQRRQGTALALYGGLGNLAPGLFALVLPGMVVALGLTRSYVIWLALLVLLVVLVALCMKDAPYFQYKAMGLAIDPEALLLACGQELIPSGQALASLRRAGADWRTWVLTYFYFVTFGGFIALTVWLPTYWTELFGASLVAAGGLTALYSLSCSLLRVAGGMAADRLGGERVVLLAFGLVVAGSLVMMVNLERPALAVAGQMLLAAGMGAANAAVFKLVPLYTPAAVGGAAGIVGGLGAFGGFAIPPVMGLLVALEGRTGYGRGFVVFLVLALGAVGFFGLLNRFGGRGAPAGASPPTPSGSSRRG